MTALSLSPIGKTERGDLLFLASYDHKKTLSEMLPAEILGAVRLVHDRFKGLFVIEKITSALEGKLFTKEVFAISSTPENLDVAAQFFWNYRACGK